MSQHSEELISPIGGNMAYVLKNAKVIGEFIRANSIKESTIGVLSHAAAPTAKPFVDLGIPGGIRAAHLHFDNKIYMLTDEQWTTFSAKIIADCKAKLDHVKSVSFEQGMQLGNAVQTLT